MPGAQLPQARGDRSASQLVRSARRARGQTQAQLGHDLGGVCVSTIANWEAGRSEPPPAVCLLLTEWLTPPLTGLAAHHGALLALQSDVSAGRLAAPDVQSLANLLRSTLLLILQQKPATAQN